MKRGPGPARKAPMKRGDPAKADAWRRRSAEKAQETPRTSLSRPTAPSKARTPLSRTAKREKAPIAPERRIELPAPPPVVYPEGARHADWHGGEPGQCVRCNSPRTVRHHVVYEQAVRAAAPERIYDPANRMWLCGLCHMAHHDGSAWRVPLGWIRDETISFAFEILGAGGYDWLRRRYAGDDARLDFALENFPNTTPGHEAATTEGAGPC